jgi:hypothetical protein
MSAVSSSKATRRGLIVAGPLCIGALTHAQPPDAVFPADEHREVVVRVCSGCHPPELVIAQRRTVRQWDDIVARMIERGAEATEEEQLQIAAYFVRHYGKQD